MECDAAHSVGSSPRMRGKPRPAHIKHHAQGLIPAHAGKTRVALSGRCCHWAHPRACGENAHSTAPFTTSRGSSPRMRGKRGTVTVETQSAGLIPAHAGKTVSGPDFDVCGGAHPRACGENRIDAAGWLSTSGSSPRMRGKLRVTDATENRVGLIPAHAGKTAADSDCFESARAHPRACGENAHIFEGEGGRGGSSPRMRGKLPESPRDLARLGLIPAHAGKTLRQDDYETLEPAHPRACGENIPKNRMPRKYAGSSPRMRGKLFDCHVALSFLGLIPAHAGKTSRTMGPLSASRAHPRACGENRLSAPS